MAAVPRLGCGVWWAVLMLAVRSVGGLWLCSYDTSILHHVFLLLFIMFLSLIMLSGVILMSFLS